MTDLAAAAPTRDYRIIGLVSVAHGASHFYQLVLPMLFPVLKDQFGVTYVELGAMMTLMLTVSGICQTVAGFMVDRYGARTVLHAGIALTAGAYALMAAAPNFWAMLPMVALAGAGNSVFHPADYSILTAKVSAARIGRAYSIHTFCGNIGWMLVPTVVLGLQESIGWRGALLVVGGAGLLFLVYLMAQGDALPNEGRKHREAEGSAAAEPLPTSVLFSLPVLLCLAYFTLLALSSVTLQSFLPTVLHALHDTPLTIAGHALTAYLMGASAGILTGGYLADKGARPDFIVAVGLASAATLFVIVGQADWPAPALIALLAATGFASGCTTPSRDLLVRGAAPQGATGSVFGFVYSGLDIGGAIGPLVIGLMLDNGHPAWVFWYTAAIMAFGITTAFSLKRVGR
jgi:MFS family permease